MTQNDLDDGLPVRDAGVWTEDKLAIVRDYLRAFGRACSKKAPTFYFADGFSGPGINRIRDTAELVPGSPLLALESEPQFAKCLLMDLGEQNIQTMEARTARYGERALVRKGDCNVDLVPAMQDALDQRNPCFCLLDPEGSELGWDTVSGVARFRRGRNKVEQLILLPTHIGFIRMLVVDGTVPEWAAEKLTNMYGNDRWKDIHRRRVEGVITTDAATTEYVRLYAEGLRNLGYSWVLDREIRDRGFEGPLRYFLIFATDHDAGFHIMDHIFDTVARARANGQLSLFRVPRRRRT